MLSVRGGMGLGDALYVQAIARHLIGQGQRVEACTAWPDVFRPLGDKVVVSPFRRDRIDRLAHYSLRRDAVGTDQFHDCCIQAGIIEPVDLRLDWVPVVAEWHARLRANGKPIVVVPIPRAPMDRKDGLGVELLPDYAKMQAAIDRLRGRAYVVQVGAGKPLHRFAGIDCDLANRTGITDLIDVVQAADVIIGYVSFLLPLAESLDKPALFLWSRRGLGSSHEVIRRLTPRKVIHKKDRLVRAVIDDCSASILAEAVDALCEQVGCALAA